MADEIEITTEKVDEEREPTKVDLDAKDEEILGSEQSEPVTAENALEEVEKIQEKKLPKERAKRISITESVNQVFATPQGKTIGTGVLTVLAVAVLVFFAITPALSSITRQTDLNNALNNRIQLQQSKISSITQLLNRQQENESEIAEFQEILSEDKQQSQIYTELLAFVISSNLRFQSMSFNNSDTTSQPISDGVVSPRLKVQLINLSARGNISDVPRFVERIENSKRILQVTDISVASQQEPGQVQVNLNIRSYFWSI